MNVREIMTRHPTTCRPHTSSKEAAALMSKVDCGALPVVDEAGMPVGIVTDRDICCRLVAKGLSPETPVSEIMTTKIISVHGEHTVAQCCDLMETKQIRRALVVDKDGRCCGIVAQADVARQAGQTVTAELVKDISKAALKP